jgi:protein TonB
MKTLKLLLLSVMFCTNIFGQDLNNKSILSDSIALAEFFYENMHYSLMNFANKNEDIVRCQFDIDSVGRIDNIQLISDSKHFDIEAKRLIYAIPTHQSDYNKTYNVSINFNLEDNKICQNVEEMPEFPGGMQKMMDFINRNLHFPVEASEMAIQGRVICGFVVEKDGTISIMEVVRSLYHPIDAEAIRVIGRMPRWKAGRQNGKPVRVYFLLPVRINLQN